MIRAVCHKPPAHGSSLRVICDYGNDFTMVLLLSYMSLVSPERSLSNGSEVGAHQYKLPGSGIIFGSYVYEVCFSMLSPLNHMFRGCN